MLALLRTYRPLAAVLAAFVVVGLALPLVQEVCAMGAPTRVAHAAAMDCCCPVGDAHEAGALPACCTLAAQERPSAAATLHGAPVLPEAFTTDLPAAVAAETRLPALVPVHAAALSPPARPAAFLLHAVFLI